MNKPYRVLTEVELADGTIIKSDTQTLSEVKKSLSTNKHKPATLTDEEMDSVIKSEVGVKPTKTKLLKKMQTESKPTSRLAKAVASL